MHVFSQVLVKCIQEMVEEKREEKEEEGERGGQHKGDASAALIQEPAESIADNVTWYCTFFIFQCIKISIISRKSSENDVVCYPVVVERATTHHSPGRRR